MKGDRMIEVVRTGEDIEVVRAHFVPLGTSRACGRTAHKETCVECERQYDPSQMSHTTDGPVCTHCRDDA